MNATEAQELLTRPIAFHPVFVRVTKSITAALMLSQAWYWKARGRNKNGWFYKTQREWQEETGLSRHEQDTARRILRDKGLIDERRMGIPCKVHFRVNVDAVISAINEAINSAGNQQSSLPDSGKLDCGGQTNSIASHRQSNTENTTENTTESDTRPRFELIKTELDDTRPDGRPEKKKEKAGGRAVPDTPHHRLIAKRVEVFGKCPNMGPEVQAAKWLLENFEESQIHEYMGVLQQAAIERGFAPSLQLVAKQIDGYFKRKAASLGVTSGGVAHNSPRKHALVL